MSFYRCPTEVTIMSGRQEHSILHAALSAQERREYRSLKKKRYSSIDTRVSPGYRRVSAGVSPEYRRSIARYRNFTRHLAGISTEYRKLNPPWSKLFTQKEADGLGNLALPVRLAPAEKSLRS